MRLQYCHHSSLAITINTSNGILLVFVKERISVSTFIHCLSPTGLNLTNLYTAIARIKQFISQRKPKRATDLWKNRKIKYSTMFTLHSPLKLSECWITTYSWMNHEGCRSQRQETALILRPPYNQSLTHQPGRGSRGRGGWLRSFSYIQYGYKQAVTAKKGSKQSLSQLSQKCIHPIKFSTKMC